MSNAVAANGSVTNETKNKKITIHFAVTLNPETGEFSVKEEKCNGSNTTNSATKNSTTNSATKNGTKNATNATTNPPAVLVIPPEPLTPEQKIGAIMTIPALDRTQSGAAEVRTMMKDESGTLIPDRDSKIRYMFAKMITIPVDSIKDIPVRSAGAKDGGELPSLRQNIYTGPEMKIISDNPFASNPKIYELLQKKYIQMGMPKEIADQFKQKTSGGARRTRRRKRNHKKRVHSFKRKQRRRQ